MSTEGLNPEEFSQLMNEEFMRSAYYQQAIAILRALNNSKDTFINDYGYLQKTVNADPGTAGKECQDVFADFLRKYLSKDIEIIVDGTITLANGELSPQLDLILVKDMPEVLKGSYIPLEYVLAVFEVKLTLRKSHFEKILKTAAILRISTREGTPREVLFGKIIYGVMALSSKLTNSATMSSERSLKLNTDECNAVQNAIKGLPTPAHPSQAIDLILVADAFSLCASKTINYSELYPNSFPDIQLGYHFSISSHPNITGASGLSRTLCAHPTHHHIGAFLYRLFLLLYREGAASERSPDAFFYFDSPISSILYSWGIEVLGEDFKSNWIARVNDETLEWSNIHP